MGFDRDSAFSFQIHVIKHLSCISRVQQYGLIPEADQLESISMVDMGNDGKIADIFYIVFIHNILLSTWICQ